MCRLMADVGPPVLVAGRNMGILAVDPLWHAERAVRGQGIVGSQARISHGNYILLAIYMSTQRRHEQLHS